MERYQMNPKLALLTPDSHFAQELFDLIDRNRAYLTEHLPWVGKVQTVSDSQAFLQTAINDFGIKSKIYLIQYQTQLIGVISFNRIDPANQEVDIGYWLAQDWQGKGIISQCLAGLLEMHKGIYQHFVLKCAVKNVKSNAVARRNGFTFCERLPQAECLNGVYYDQNKYVKHIMA